MEDKIALIIGAGPGGLTAAYELLKRTGIKPVIIESADYVGGISRTAVYKGNRIDIGGHRFFSKSDRVTDWWFNILPMERGKESSRTISYHDMTRTVPAQKISADPEREDRVMLVRERKSRIYFNKRFFDYPLKLSPKTLKSLGFTRTMRVGASYMKAIFFPIKDPKNLEEFYINKFGRELYETFFESYTQKVWGKPCKEISAEWGAQRVKGLSLRKALTDFLSKRLLRGRSQKKVETSLIESFFYPKLGPGQMWETVAEDVKAMGGKMLMGYKAIRFDTRDDRILSVVAFDKASGREQTIKADYFFSTMPVKDLIACLNVQVPKGVRFTSERLEYRDFITVGLLLKKLKVCEPDGSLIKDNWIYVQEPDAKVCRIQIFNNWSPYLVADKETVWVGLEYCVTEGDILWKMADKELINLGVQEMADMGLCDEEDLLDAVVIRMKKTYPGYFGEYKNFDKVRGFLDRFENLFLIGRNGMHKYNNQDHSMLTAMTAVDNIIAGRKDKANIWAVNTENEYHEEHKK